MHICNLSESFASAHTHMMLLLTFILKNIMLLCSSFSFKHAKAISWMVVYQWDVKQLRRIQMLRTATRFQCMQIFWLHTQQFRVSAHAKIISITAVGGVTVKMKNLVLRCGQKSPYSLCLFMFWHWSVAQRGLLREGHVHSIYLLCKYSLTPVG